MSERNIKTRKYFTNKIKRSVLIEYTKGKKPTEIFSDLGIDFTQDKKYAPKLINKWKNELYKNINIIALNFANTDFNYLEKEINSIGDDSETDDIVKELLIKSKNS